ncbi:MAG: phage Gp37/Gp68 family protein [Acidovorax sp.]|nr:phage Gp37/Gp68 family protein [Acidovorax sp.]
MSASNIEWTDFTWNPVRGCSRKSKGCLNCYAEHQAARIVRMDRGRGIPEGQGAYDGLVEMTSQGPKWTGKISEVWDALETPLRMKKPRRIFVNSMSDLFHDGVSENFIAEVLAHAAYARQHTFQILTKCPERMQKLLTSEAFMELYEDACSGVSVEAEEILARRGEFSVHARLTTDIRAMNPAWPRPNIQLGVSTEDQDTANERVPLLLATPAAVRFVSAEPLLGAIDFTRIQNAGPLHTKAAFINALRGGTWGEVPTTGERLRITHGPLETLDWIIAGGESGHKARPSHPDWYRSLRDQCAAAGVPFLFKQWGQWRPTDTDYVVDERQNTLPIHRWTNGDRSAKVGKKAAGRLLDGIEHNGFPS